MDSRTEKPREIFSFLACLSDDLLMDIAVELNDTLAALTPRRRSLSGVHMLHRLGAVQATLIARGYTIETRTIRNDAGEEASMLLFDKETS